MISDEKWAALLERSKAVRGRAKSYAAAGKPVRFSGSNGITYLVSRDLSYPDNPDAWRVTYFQADGQPSGHYEARSCFEAFREVIAGGSEPI